MILVVSFSAETDLKVEVAAPVRDQAHPVLPDQNEGGEQHTFDPENTGQQGKRERIEDGQTGDDLAVRHSPEPDEGELANHEGDAPGEAADHLGEAIRKRATAFLFFL